MISLLVQVLLLTAVHAAPLLHHTPRQQLQYVTLEEHCVPKVSAAELDGNPLLLLLLNGTFGPTLIPDLLDSNTNRIESMNANNIRKQVVNNDNFDLDNATAAFISNNGIYAEYTQPYPDRFSAFCTLAMGQPAAAAQELERCVTELGFVGGLTNSKLPNGTFYDSSVFWPVFATAERLDVPLYLHPAFPTTDSVLTTGGAFAPAVNPDGTKSYDEFIAANLGTTSWQFEADTGLSFLRLYAAGVFEAYPNLKIVLGHLGEMVPYMLERSNEFLSPLTAPKKSLEQVWADNVWITTSGWFWLEQMPTVLRTTAPDRIMYSVDTPFNKNYEGTAFMDKLRDSGLVTPEEFEGIGFRNAEALLKLI